jgi:plasmid stabilization system protein ParE
VRYRLQISRRAAGEIEGHYNWLADRDSEAADRWRAKLYAAIEGLTTMPERHAPAAETAWCERNIREMYFGRRGSTWRVVFEIQDRVVFVARVRHGRQDLLHPGDL